MAVKEGGEDAELNPKLRSAILSAKAENMPKDNIDAAIKRASGKDAALMSVVTFEGKSAEGALIFIECATDNNTRTVANVKSYFNKLNGQLLQNGSLEFMFSRKSVFEFAKTDEIDLESLELDLIDAGLDELEEHDGTVYVYGDYTAFGALAKALDGLHIEITKSSLQRIANTPVSFSEEELENIEKLLDKLEEDEDVQVVFTNIE
jgi:YebC/PmpR family DNA-binding regulatory protein